MERQGLDSMDKVFDYVSDFQFSFVFTKLIIELYFNFTKFDFTNFQICNTYEKDDALGTREIIREEDEVQPNGKVFK